MAKRRKARKGLRLTVVIGAVGTIISLAAFLFGEGVLSPSENHDILLSESIDQTTTGDNSPIVNGDMIINNYNNSAASNGKSNKSKTTSLQNEKFNSVKLNMEIESNNSAIFYIYDDNLKPIYKMDKTGAYNHWWEVSFKSNNQSFVVGVMSPVGDFEKSDVSINDMTPFLGIEETFENEQKESVTNFIFDGEVEFTLLSDSILSIAFTFPPKYGIDFNIIEDYEVEICHYNKNEDQPYDRIVKKFSTQDTLSDNTYPLLII